MISSQQRAFLDMLAISELGPKLLAKSDNGYNVLVGSTPSMPRLFSSYADHPRQLIDLPRLGIKSTAAGRYQLLARYFDAYKKLLKLPDFSPASQDAIALRQIRERGALDDIEAGRLADAISKCRNIWASLPGAGYGQNENALAYLQTAFVKSGGMVA